MGTHARLVFVVSVIVTIAIYTVPQLRVVAWPLVLLSTLAHELGHGLTAVVAGGDFESMRMWSDGSGVAAWRGGGGRLQQAAVAAGGLLGPAIAAAFCLVFGSTARGARVALAVLGASLLAITLLLVRNGFGLVFVGGTGALALAIAMWAQPALVQAVLVFASVQLGLAVFSRADYLFTAVAQTSAGEMPSDVAQIAQALLLPYWFWGAVCAIFSLACLVGGMTAFLRATANRAG